MEPFLLSSVVFLGVFTQSVAGFGVALITMALLPGLIGLHTAAPLVALVALALEAALLVRYWRDLHLKAVLVIALSSALTVPLGMFGVRLIDERVALGVLGSLIAGYALYALFNPRLPALRHPAWAYTAGFLAGVLGGAYNTSGPPVVIYGHCRGWSPQQFKGNLQGFFLINSFFVVAGHMVNGNITPGVWNHFLALLPVMAIGTVAGLSLDRLIHPQIFRKIVLWLLIGLGLRLLISG